MPVNNANPLAARSGGRMNSVATGSVVKPAAPVISAAGISGTINKILFKFTMNAAKFKLWEADDILGTNKVSLDDNIVQNFFEHSSLTPGTEHFYFAKASNSAGDSIDFSTGVSATTLSGHARKRIRDKITLLLTGNVLFNSVAVTVLKNRTIPIAQLKLPVIVVYGKTELNDDRETNPKINYPDYSAITQIIVEADSGEGGQDDCDEISNQIEGILGVNRIALGLEDVDELNYGSGSFQFDNSGDKNILSFIQGWPVRYQKDFPSANDQAAYGEAPDDFITQKTDITTGDAGLIQSETDIQ